MSSEDNSEVDKIIDALNNLNHFVYRKQLSEKIHLYSSETVPDMFLPTKPYITACGKEIMINGARYHRYVSRPSRALTSAVCKTCLKKIKTNPERYGYHIDEVLFKTI